CLYAEELRGATMGCARAGGGWRVAGVTGYPVRRLATLAAASVSSPPTWKPSAAPVTPLLGDTSFEQLLETRRHAASPSRLYQALSNAELAIAPGTSHGLLVEKPDLCYEMIIDFFANDPIHTFSDPTCLPYHSALAVRRDEALRHRREFSHRRLARSNFQPRSRRPVLAGVGA
ncbi:MAG: alpha/beta fold hydrolase, partial [bacterium]